MSVAGSVPTTWALNSRLSSSWTVTLSASATTWLFVRMKPSGETTKPEPVPLSGARPLLLELPEEVLESPGQALRVARVRDVPTG